MDRDVRAQTAGVVAVTAAATAAAALSPPPGRVAIVASAQVLGAVGVVWGVRHQRPARPQVWWALLATAVAYAVAWWCVLLDAGPVPVAVTCLAAFVAMGRVVVLVGRPPEPAVAVDALDVALLALSAAAGAAALTGALSGGAAPMGPTTDTWLSAQAAGTVVFSTAGVWAVVTHRARRSSARLLLATASGLVAWHVATLVVALTAGYEPGSLVDVLVVPSWGAVVAAAWQPTMRELGRPVAPSGRAFPGSLSVLAAALTLGSLPVLDRVGAERVAPSVLVLAIVATAVLLVARELAVSRRAARMVDSDALTGVGTRRSLVRALSARLTDPDSGPALLCVVDLEAFGDVNDTRGHAVGDRVLVRVADRLVEAGGPGSSTFRVSGDGFAVLLPCAGAAASRVGDRLLDAVAQPLPAPGGAVRLRARAGEVALPGRPVADPDDDAAAQLAATGQLGDAELALAEAERQRVRVVRATPELLARHRDERELAAQLPGALAAHRVLPHYQPLVRLGATADLDRRYGFEALARWDHPARGVVGADRLVPVAERLGVLPDLDAAVLRAAVADCALWRAAGALDWSVAVNASAGSLLREDLVPLVLGALDAADLPGAALVLEITEGSWLEDRAGIAARLSALRSAGVRVAVDDFGTGYASLDYLVSFPVDAIKVDRSLVERIAEPACARLLRSVVTTSTDLGAVPLAEGVGTADQLERARDLGFVAAQGLAVGGAVPAAQVALPAEPAAAGGGA